MKIFVPNFCTPALLANPTPHPTKTRPRPSSNPPNAGERNAFLVQHHQRLLCIGQHFLQALKVVALAVPWVLVYGKDVDPNKHLCRCAMGRARGGTVWEALAVMHGCWLVAKVTDTNSTCSRVPLSNPPISIVSQLSSLHLPASPPVRPSADSTTILIYYIDIRIIMVHVHPLP